MALDELTVVSLVAHLSLPQAAVDAIPFHRVGEGAAEYNEVSLADFRAWVERWIPAQDRLAILAEAEALHNNHRLHKNPGGCTKTPSIPPAKLPK